MENEIWKEVKGYEGIYEVSDFGNVKSLGNNFNKKEKILKKILVNNGYYSVGLCKNGKQKNKSIHKIVAESFLNHVSCKMELIINHINFNKIDNRLENLEIVTARENSNQKHIKSSSKYVGVGWHNKINKWQSRIYINKKSYHLGYFINEIEAHNAYQKALIQASKSAL